MILSANTESEINESKQYLDNIAFPIKPAKIIEVRDVGTGERVCVDTTSILEMGEGLLVGSRSNFMFLVHNESVGSSFTSPRPFRDKRRSCCYTIAPEEKTKYLSEIESGSEVLIVHSNGNARRVTVGRSKIETRPLRLIRAEIDGETGTVILQNAETIRLLTKEGALIPVTEAKVGEHILAYSKPQSGRHFGIEVEEYVLEK